jgi:L-amino acid N-acyltransferase
MLSQLQIRPATGNDIPAITDIYNHAILNTTATFDTEPRTVDDRMEWFHTHTEDHPVLVAVSQDIVIGWASISPFKKRDAYRYTVEDTLYVSSGYQGMGVGTALLDRVVRVAEMKSYRVIVAIITGGNEASLRLHRRFGFEKVGELHGVGWKSEQWLDVVYLQKTLCT